MKKDGKKIFVMDTNVLIHDPQAIEKFGENYIVIPNKVIDELDKLKNSSGARGFGAREASRIIDKYKEKGKVEGKSLRTGVELTGGGLLVVDRSRNDLRDMSNDDQIIMVAKGWGKYNPTKKLVIISKDINLRTKANAAGVEEEDYVSKGISREKELYSGTKEINMPEKEAGIITEWHKDGGYARLGDVPIGDDELFANQCCVFAFGDKTVLAIYNKNDGIFNLVDKPKKNSKSGKVAPKNIEQSFAFSLLMNEKVKVVALSGKAGTGKTLMAIGAACRQVEEGTCERILVYRPNMELGPDFGTLPGDVDEKFSPWKYPILDNLKVVFGKNGDKKMKELLDKKTISIEPISFIQGRTLHNSFIIIDEAQNLEPKEIKAILTRPGEGSKIILCGDPAQIVHPYLDERTNGLTHLIERFKGQEIFGHVALTKSERSYLTELSANLL